MDILQQAPEIRLRRKAHGSIMVYEPQPSRSSEELLRNVATSTLPPLVCDQDPTSLKIGCIAGGGGSLFRSGDGCDLAVNLAYGASKGAALGRYGGIGPCGCAIERQDSIAEILFQHAINCLGGSVTLADHWQDRYAIG